MNYRVFGIVMLFPVLLIGMNAHAKAQRQESSKFLLLNAEVGEQSVVAVFNNNEESKPRCPCATFSILVAEPSILGPTRISNVEVVVREDGKIISKRNTKERTAIYRCPESPWYTEQNMVEIVLPTGTKQVHRTVEVKATRETCLNPTAKGCKKEILVASREISTKELFSLKEATPSEVASELSKKSYRGKIGCN